MSHVTWGSFSIEQKNGPLSHATIWQISHVTSATFTIGLCGVYGWPYSSLSPQWGPSEMEESFSGGRSSLTLWKN